MIKSKQTNRQLAYLSLAGFSCFIISVILLHWVQPGLDPLTEAVSFYVHGVAGWLLPVGLLGLGIGSLVLSIGVGNTVHGPGVRPGRWLLSLWSIGVILSGIFATDPPGNWDQPPTLPGLIHGNAALIAILAFPFAAFLLVRSFQHDPRWQRRTPYLLFLAIIVAICLGTFMASLLPVMISPGPPILFGLIERILLGFYVLWLGTVAFGLMNT